MPSLTRHEQWVVIGLLVALLLGAGVRAYRRGSLFSPSPSLNSTTVSP